MWLTIYFLLYGFIFVQPKHKITGEEDLVENSNPDTPQQISSTDNEECPLDDFKSLCNTFDVGQEIIDWKRNECESSIRFINDTIIAVEGSCQLEMKLEKLTCKLRQQHFQAGRNYFGRNSNSFRQDICAQKCQKAPVLMKLIETLVNLSTGYYYISAPNEKENWFMADKYCKSNGMELASIETADENRALISALGDGNDRFWLSGTDLGSEGNFYWSSNAKLLKTFIDFEIAQPDNLGGKEHCIQFRRSRDERKLKYKWNDDVCKSRNRFICELESNKLFKSI
ncbi:Hypothetical predicted protein [Cloeon dipterum]|uniref:C-type lectin domain-containing protein n=1 Tax=Cloeon dipterum TaxID=197152 RepID=A0A8S1BVX7_9INSE|nr:Hypothetical predicted protein [Cloeon dipterum]